MMDGFADGAAGDIDFADGGGHGCGVLVCYWCRIGGRGRRHCGSGSLWWCDAVERGGCDWGGGCEGAGEGREWEPCRLVKI